MATANDRETTAARLDWRGANLRGATLSHMVLDNADFRGADLRDVNFTHSSLRYVDLRGAQIQGANFQHASLYGAKMQGVEADRADFRAADLRLANWGGAYLQGAQMPAETQAAPTPDVFERNGHPSAQEKPPKTVNGQAAADKQPEPPRRRR
jgi:uncharacterized protein YjbI with pentapeptide repeats